MNWKIVVLIVLAAVALVAGLVVYEIVSGAVTAVSVDRALERHEDELRAIPGVTTLGTHRLGSEATHIVVWVDKMTPEIRAAVPDELDGYRVDVELEPLPPVSPPVIEGRITSVTPATPEQVAAGIAGTVTVTGKLFERGMGNGAPVRRTLTVRVPADIQVWRPQGEGKEFSALGDVDAGENGRPGAQRDHPGGTAGLGAVRPERSARDSFRSDIHPLRHHRTEMPERRRRPRATSQPSSVCQRFSQTATDRFISWAKSAVYLRA